MWDIVERREVRRVTRRLAAHEPGSRPRPGEPAGTDLLPQIRHIVVLMMENHSYDNYLGMLPGRGEGFPLGPDGQPDVSCSGSDGEAIRAFRLASTRQPRGMPTQSWHACHEQWAGGRCDGFVTSAQAVQAQARAGDAEPCDTSAAAAASAMGYWTEADLPFYYGLARTFPVADRWFSSCLGPTFPNRRFLIAGTAHGLIDDSPYDLLDYPPAGTIFDMLTRHEISWANYHPVATERRPRWTRYARHKRKMTRRRLQSLCRSLPAVSQGVEKDLKFTADVFPVGIGRYMEHVRSASQFFADAEAGTLPGFSIVDPDFDAFSEENPQDIQKGESYAAEVINAVLHGEGWPHTLLIWVYDEHGGYYDHVPPPAAIPPDDVPGQSTIGTATGLDAFLRPLFPKLVRRKKNMTQGPRDYDRYGFRVPAVIVSPYARPGYVCSEVLDHTSVLRLAEEKWNLPALTARDAAASTPLDALDLRAEPAFLHPPALPAPALRWGSW
ncbi:MAG TPA: alkaline phosphatase family protein [Streptosporangiaceae bacterium]|jgi:phospholipase C